MPDEEPKAPVVEGDPIGVEARIVGVKWVDHKYGRTLKMLVEVGDETTGYYRLWGSVPKSLENPQPDMRVSFLATVIQSPDDPSFGWAKRIRNAIFV